MEIASLRSPHGHMLFTHSMVVVPYACWFRFSILKHCRLVQLLVLLSLKLIQTLGAHTNAVLL